MPKGEHGLWIDVSDLDVDRIKQILYGGSGTFTIAVPPDAIRQGSSQIVLLSLRAGFVSHIFTYSGTLTILNANRTSIERTLGVDLLYYNHTYQAFTFVQYKRMTGSKDPVYRPTQDVSLGKEIKRMDDFESQCEVPSHSYGSYRLIDSPFFLKLCSASVPGSWNGRMLPGMYFPLRLWKLLVASNGVQGPRGGLAVGYDQTPRRFSNSDFMMLLKQGWIGSSGTNSDRINSLLEQTLSAKHSVVAASHEPDVKRRDYYRDDWGRFAEEEDESAI